MNIENFQFELITVNTQNDSFDVVQPIIHYKNSRRHKTKIVLSKEECEETKISWRLRKYIRSVIYDGLDFTPMSAKDRLTDEITAEKIAKFLNDDFVFDFEYEPDENDEIRMEIQYVIENINGKIRRPYSNYFVSFLYDGKEWIVNKGFDHIHNHYEEFKEGIVKYIV
ncbi:MULTISPECIES: hypothetical protein [Chryseobacterium]|uniref:Uncharacterized protein n=1 Tax=Chryseobacterium taihuense TaxID=1141221 RepID=A0A4U8WJJ8_9FLAO|nr:MULTISPECIES: hypothetical protein [Chryseobacterium]QQV04330.1 hypothetical protein I6I61_08345 [Chryseobacterium sp. FDAARGOS 1104]VFB02299.1 Uncharacterised protein [Chryseobacterium taihuense]